MIRTMKAGDYEGVYSLWMSIKGFAMRSIDDSREGVERFLARNPKTSVVALEEGKIVGAILCGHDGRRGCMYHVCVHEDYRMRGIGKAMVVFAMEALKKEEISKVFFDCLYPKRCGECILEPDWVDKKGRFELL